jgi:Tfp pilus assembly protein FimT
MLLLGIVLSLAVPSLTATLEITKLKADANEMAQFLRLARQDAVTSEKTSMIVFYSNSNRYKVYNSSYPLGATHLLNQGNIIVGISSFTQKVGGNPACAFYPSGAPGSGGTVTIKNKNNQKLYIIVNPVAGRVRISDKPPENW